MPARTKEMDTLSAFERNPAAFIEQLKKTGEPLVLTVDGRPELIVQDAASYQRIYELAERMEALESIRKGLDDIEKGRTFPLREVIKQLGQKNER